MRIAVFDTETIGLDKPFIYNIGWLIYDTKTSTILAKHDFVVEQIWHNAELFDTAYYADKRKDYVKRMRGKTCRMEKMGYITQFMSREFKFFEVEYAYAYNSPFDEKAFNYSCEWFKVINPFDDIPLLDIRGYVHRAISFTPEFQEFCEEHSYFTESGHYSTTAETVYRFLLGDADFVEAHTALADSEIELDILARCVEKGCKFGSEYKVYRTISREKMPKVLEITNVDGETSLYDYNKITIRKEIGKRTQIILKKIEK